MSAPNTISEQLVKEDQPKSVALPRGIRLLKGITIPVILILSCEIIVRNGVIEPYLLPAPSSLWQSLTELAEGDLWQHLWASSWRVFFRLWYW
jgi:sulfonate transport system permease protein